MGEGVVSIWVAGVSDPRGCSREAPVSFKGGGVAKITHWPQPPSPPKGICLGHERTFFTILRSQKELLPLKAPFPREAAKSTHSVGDALEHQNPRTMESPGAAVSSTAHPAGPGGQQAYLRQWGPASPPNKCFHILGYKQGWELSAEKHQKANISNLMQTENLRVFCRDMFENVSPWTFPTFSHAFAEPPPRHLQSKRFKTRPQSHDSLFPPPCPGFDLLMDADCHPGPFKPRAPYH